jgi:short-subunit dehydrogenase
MDQPAHTARLRLENQVVVTGGSRGIGEGIVRRFVEEGAKVVFSGLSSEKGKALEVELSPNVAFYRSDAASSSDTESLLKFAVERFGRLDCPVNNAGVGGEGGPIAGTSVEGFNKSIGLLRTFSIESQRLSNLGRAKISHLGEADSQSMSPTPRFGWPVMSRVG